MYEREIKFITDFNLNMVKKLGSFFTIDHLVNSKIHPALVQYIDAELEYLIYLDRQRLLHKSLFDYSGKEISSHLSAISAVIKKNKLLPYEEVKRLIHQAVTFNVNFLSRPQWTLKKFVYDNEESRSAEEIRLFMGYTYFYEYYRQIVEKYVEKKNILSLSFSDFNERLRILSRELMKSQSSILLSDAMQSMADFINIGETQKSKLPVGIVETFLKDLSLSELVFKVKKFLSSDPKMRFEIDDYLNAFFTELPAGSVVAVQDEDEEFVTPGAETAETIQEGVTKIAEPTPVSEDSKTPALFQSEVNLDDLFKEHPAVTVSEKEILELEEKLDTVSKQTDSERVTPGEFVRNVTSELESIKDEYEKEKRNISAQTVVNEIREAITQLDDQKNLGNDAVATERGTVTDNKTNFEKEVKPATDSVPLSNENFQDKDDSFSSAQFENEEISDLQLNLSNIIEGYGTIEFHDDSEVASSDEKNSVDSVPQVSLSDENLRKSDVTFELLENEIQKNSDPDSSNLLKKESDTSLNAKSPAEYLENPENLSSPEFTVASIEIDSNEKNSGVGQLSGTGSIIDNFQQKAELSQSDETPAMPFDQNDQENADNEQDIKQLDIETTIESTLHPPQRNEQITAALADTFADSSDNETELFEYFTTKETMRIISAIFGNDSVDFMTTIEKIAQCSSISEANEILKSVFHSYHINPLTSKEANILQVRVSRYFEEKK